MTVEQLFASIPEIGDLFVDIFDSKPRWATPVPDQMTNTAMMTLGQVTRVRRSYVLIVDDSARLTKEDIALLPGPIRDCPGALG